MTKWAILTLGTHLFSLILWITAHFIIRFSARRTGWLSLACGQKVSCAPVVWTCTRSIHARVHVKNNNNGMRGFPQNAHAPTSQNISCATKKEVCRDPKSVGAPTGANDKRCVPAARFFSLNVAGQLTPATEAPSTMICTFSPATGLPTCRMCTCTLLL